MRQLKITKQVTNRETASLDKYLQEIGKVDLITAEEEVELAQRIKAGDQIALEKLTKANLRFVVSVAKQYQNQGLTLPDLINEGNLGLIKAAQRFDETSTELNQMTLHDNRFQINLFATSDNVNGGNNGNNDTFVIFNLNKLSNAI